MDPPDLAPPPLSLEPVASQCKACEQAFDTYKKRIPMDVYSSSGGLLQGGALERHCSQCDHYFMGNLRYTRRDMVVQGVRQVADVATQDIIAAFSGRRGYRVVTMF